MSPKSVSQQNRIFVAMIKNQKELLKQPRIIAKINKVEVQAIIDSGASVSIIQEDSLPPSAIINTHGFAGLLCDVSSSLNVKGTTNLNLELEQGVVVNHNFIILSNQHRLPTNIIIGADILSRVSAIVNFDSKKISGCYKNRKFTKHLFSGIKAPPIEERCYLIHSKETCNNIIPPNSEIFYKAFTKAPNGQYGISKSTLVDGCFVAESLVEVKDNIVYVKILNIKDKPVILPNNSIISQLYVFSDDCLLSLDVKNDNVLAPITMDHVPSLKDKVGNVEILKILNKYRNCISVSGEKLGKTNLVQATINTGNSPPIYTKQFPLPHKQRSMVKNLCDEMLDQGIIEKSISPWNSPMFLVKKSNGQFRPVVDFRKINAVTIPDPYPLPRINEILQNLHGSSIFSTLDLNSGYFQVELAKEDQKKTAFTTDRGRFEFKRAPYGLRSMPNIFSRLMEIAMADLLGSHVWVYIDDLIVHSKDIESHVAKLDAVFNRLSEANLTVKLQKCNFLEKKLKYLGNEISEHGISIHSDHFLPIQVYKPPTSRKEVQKFLGLISYFRGFIPKFAEICEPITTLLKLDKKFAWNDEAQTAFERIKQEILSAGKLIYPDFSEPFFIQTDASNFTIGGALCQVRNGIILPICFVSRGLSKTEKNYSTTKRELLAIAFSLKKFRSLILGYHTTIFTDHKPLVNLIKTSSPEGTMGRWILQAQEYDLDIRYLPGHLNILGDSLSRIKQCADSSIEVDSENDLNDFIALVGRKPTFNWSLDELKRKQLSDNQFGPIIKCLMGKEKSIKKSVKLDEYVYINKTLYKKIFRVRSGVEHTQMCICVPTSMAQTIITNVHRSIGSGHRGFQKTLEKVKQNFFINNLIKQVNISISQCDECKQFKGLPHKKAMIEKYPLPSKPFQKISVDILGPLKTTSSNNKYILGLTDFLTRYLVIYPLPDRSAIQVANALKKFIATYDTPEVLISDNAKEFVGTTFKKVCEAAGINKCEVVPYHPAANGLQERRNLDITRILKVFCGSEYYYNDSNAYLNSDSQIIQENEWDFFLPEVQAAINSSVNKSLGDTPYFALFHFDKNDNYTGDQQISSEPIYNYDEYFNISEARGRAIYENIKNTLSKNIEKYTVAKNKNRGVRDLEINQRVFVKRVPKPGEFRKFAPKWWGPGYICEKRGPNKYKVRMAQNDNTYDVHIDNILTRHEIIKATEQNETVPVSANKNKKLPRVGNHEMITRSKVLK